MGIYARLDELEEKIDACLVLLKMVITSDDFGYTLERWDTEHRYHFKVSERWQRQMDWASQLASRVPLPEEKFRTRTGRLVPYYPPSLLRDILTSGTAGSRETSPKSNGQKLRAKRNPKK